MTVSERRGADPRDHRDGARASARKFRDERINMAHGAGGKATQGLIEGLFAPGVRSPTLDDPGRRRRRSRSAAPSWRSPPTPSSSSRSASRAARSATWRSTAPSTTLPSPGARPLALTLSLILEEGLAADDLRAEVEAIARAARGGRGRDRRRRHQGGRARPRRRHVHLHRRRRRRDPRAQLSPPALRPGDRILLSGTIGEHGTAIMLARGEFELDADDRVRHALAVAGGGRAARGGRARRCAAMRDATRGGVASVLNELARASARGDARARGARCRSQPAVAGASEILGIDPMYVANEGKLVAFVAPEEADAALAALRSVPGCERAAEIGEVRTEPPGMVLVETSFGGKRVMDQLVGRPAAADLLSEEGAAMATRRRTRSRRRPRG